MKRAQGIGSAASQIPCTSPLNRSITHLHHPHHQLTHQQDDFALQCIEIVFEGQDDRFSLSPAFMFAVQVAGISPFDSHC